MPFMSRFRKEKKDDILDGIEESLEEDVEEGLLMSTGPEAGGPAVESETLDLGPPATPEEQQGDESATDQAETPLEVADGELLAAARGGEASPPPAATLPTSEDAIDELETSAAQQPPTGEEAVDPMEASVAKEGLDTGGIEAQTMSAEPEGSGSSTDDLLSAFRETTMSGESSELTKGLEDIPIGDLLADLREVRGFLPTVQADEGEGGTGGDGKP